MTHNFAPFAGFSCLTEGLGVELKERALPTAVLGVHEKWSYRTRSAIPHKFTCTSKSVPFKQLRSELQKGGSSAARQEGHPYVQRGGSSSEAARLNATRLNSLTDILLVHIKVESGRSGLHGIAPRYV